MNSDQFIRRLLITNLILLSAIKFALAQDPVKGKALFIANNCSTCHKIDEQMVGPALGPMVTMGHKEDYLISWIQNNQALIEKKNPEALKIYNKFNQQQMPVFSNLTNKDVKDIISYIRSEWQTMQTANNDMQGKGKTGERKLSAENTWPIIALIITLIITFLIIVMLNKTIARLEGLLLNRKKVLPKKQFSKKKR
ncbi:cytochrome c [Mucilaginibacter rubeus]|uniref:Cytochrome c n=2 Tax=Mucilaginibacter rubeus TaxID=2027860 RepID=A0A364WTD4_9SPHI|nr:MULTISPECIES: cytochrome c [Mucilaginibacter]QEM06127.1 cytochrome c [Mucilaginibacter rubeus]QEM13644.1 cytochrome c [Mucilaginibacter rubeus]QEM18707.1 cytochrome c [Mucilaginibacter gossypii]QTE36298.1 cytochrome c [Mucilaginibacter gossypii]QTE44751.1 cytochrome c [Mucilaginibacter rubeus]